MVAIKTGFTVQNVTVQNHVALRPKKALPEKYYWPNEDQGNWAETFARLRVGRWMIPRKNDLYKFYFPVDAGVSPAGDSLLPRNLIIVT